MTDPKKSSRRDFISGRSAADALAQQAGAVGDAVFADPVVAPYVVSFSRQAMACEFALHLNAGQYPGAAAIALLALDQVEDLEAQLTVYRQESELSHINLLADQEPVEVEPRLFELLERSVDLWRVTDGAFDITSGPLSKVWGFSRREGKVPEDGDLQQALECVGSQHLELDPAAKTIRFAKEGVELNLGSIGKGYALDRCAEQLLDAEVQHFLFSGGRSSVLAYGDASEGSKGDDDATGGGWTVGIKDPLRPEQRLAEIRLKNRALATSGSGTQFFRHQGRRFGHILDPRSGRPAEGMYSSTVLAPTAAEADALATAFYILGHEGAMNYCNDHPQISALLVCQGNERPVVIKTAGQVKDCVEFLGPTPVIEGQP